MVGAAMGTGCNKQTASKGEVRVLIASLGPRRPIEARLTSNQSYAPIDEHRNVRGAEHFHNDDTDSPSKANLALVTARILECATEQPGEESARAVAWLDLLAGDTDLAIAQLRREMQGDISCAKVLSDLAGAYLEKADATGDPQNLVLAMSVVERALEADETLAEGFFNKALISERLFLYPEAKTVWERYLELDPTSGWADEARAHLKVLDEPKETDLWDAERQRLDDAAARGDTQTSFSIAARFPTSARSYAMDLLLGVWGTATAEGRTNDATRALTTARIIGGGLSETQGDRFVSDVVHLTDTLEAHRGESSQAHRDLSEAQRLFDIRDIAKAADLFGQARASLSQAGNQPLVAFADLYIARCLFFEFKYQDSLHILNRLQAVAEREHYRHLAGRAWLLRASILSRRFEFGRALDAGDHALQIFEMLGDAVWIAHTQTYISQTYEEIDARDEVLSHQLRAIEAIRSFGSSPYLASVLLWTAEKLLVVPSSEAAALAYVDEGVPLADAANDELFLAFGYHLRHLALIRLGRDGPAQEALAAAKSHCNLIPDEAARYRLSTAITIEEAENILPLEPLRTLELLVAIESKFKRASDDTYAFRVHELKGRALMLLGDAHAAEREFSVGIKIFETSRGMLSNESLRISFFSEPEAIYSAMIECLLIQDIRSDIAFGIAERARARALLDLIEAQQRDSLASEASRLTTQARPASIGEVQAALGDTQALVEYCVLPDRVVAWIVSAHGTDLVEAPVDSATLTDLSGTLLHAMRDARATDVTTSAKLYDLLIRPVVARLPDETSLIIVPDRCLWDVPFAALVNPLTQRFLIADHTIQIAPSASVYLQCAARNTRLGISADHGALVVGNPQVDRNTYPNLRDLPGAEAEVDAVARSHAPAETLRGGRATRDAFLSLAGQFDTVHFAGHAVYDANEPLRSRLLFAPDRTRGDDGALTAFELYHQRFLRTRLMVLAACSTASGYNTRGEGAINLARSFLVAGVPTVLASSWDVDDYAALRLFTVFHQELARGKSAAAALRVAQISLLSDPDPILNSPASWAPFQLYGGDPNAM